MTYWVLEKANLENLDEEAYFAVNPDIAKAGMTARDHLAKHGLEEGRKQLSRDYRANLSKYRSEKFQRFRRVLDLDAFDSAEETFPLAAGRSHFDLGDYASESANAGFEPFESTLRDNPDGLYLDIGCGFRERVFPNCLYLEVYPSRTADLIVEPTCLYPIKSSSLDGIGCFAVLEHTRRPWLVVQEMSRMLKPGGKVFIDWPFLQPVHGYPSHFFNATREGLRTIFEDSGFEVHIATTGYHQSPAWTVNWICRELLARLTQGSPAREALGKATIEEIGEDSSNLGFLARHSCRTAGLGDVGICLRKLAGRRQAVEKKQASYALFDPRADGREIVASYVVVCTIQWSRLWVHQRMRRPGQLNIAVKLGRPRRWEIAAA